MSDLPAVVYLEADDEITSVVRRVRAADGDRVIVVVPGRSRATSSAVALRLLARAGREVAVVGDALTRSLATEAGLAAYATLDDARSAQPSTEPPTEARHAAIHVVRGTDDTLARPAIAADEVTRPVPVAPRPTQRTRRPPLVIVGVVAVIAILLLAGVAGAAMLPGATITIQPASEAIGPAHEVIVVTDVERLSGSVTDTATVTATGEYEILRPATGTVVLFNWSGFDQAIAAGTLVAAGEQAFETQDDVVVPRGSLTPQGTIRAGEASVGVTAAAPGPAGNVGADEIDTVLSQSADARLQGGFAENNQRRVTNPEATTGGRDDSGPEITEDDVRAASTRLTEALREAADEAMAGSEELVFADLPESVQPEILGLDDLIGRRNAESVEIRGSLTYDRVTADPADVEAVAVEHLSEDVPAGWQLLEEATRLEFGEVLRAGDGLSVKVAVNGRVTAIVDRAEVIDRVAGLTAEDAETAIEDLGNATVELWPDWVASVPTTAWRIEVRVVEP